MKNFLIAIVVLVIIISTVFVFKSKKLETPAGETANEINDVNKDAKIMPPVSNTMSVPGADSSVEEMIVVKVFVVSGKNFSFTPSLITVKKGDRVKITFKNTAGFHDFVIDEFGIAIKQAQAPYEEILEFTADKVGSFEYYCSVGTHRAMGMKGILKVE